MLTPKCSEKNTRIYHQKKKPGNAKEKKKVALGGRENLRANHQKKQRKTDTDQI